MYFLILAFLIVNISIDASTNLPSTGSLLSAIENKTDKCITITLLNARHHQELGHFKVGPYRLVFLSQSPDGNCVAMEDTRNSDNNTSFLTYYCKSFAVKIEPEGDANSPESHSKVIYIGPKTNCHNLTILPQSKKG